MLKPISDLGSLKSEAYFFLLRRLNIKGHFLNAITGRRGLYKFKGKGVVPPLLSAFAFDTSRDVRSRHGIHRPGDRLGDQSHHIACTPQLHFSQKSLDWREPLHAMNTVGSLTVTCLPLGQSMASEIECVGPLAVKV